MQLHEISFHFFKLKSALNISDFEFWGPIFGCKMSSGTSVHLSKTHSKLTYTLSQVANFIMPPKQLCKFYQKGICRNGNRCNFLHVDPDEVAQPNRVTSAQQFMNLDPSTIAKDIREDLDEYRLFQMNPALTAYGTGEFAINNLIAGRDVSPEELRIQYMEALMNNKVDDYNKNIDLKKRDMEFCINEVRKKDTLAARYQQVGITHRDTMKPFIDKTVEQSMAELQNTVGNNSFGGGSGAFGSSGFGLASNSNPFGTNSNPFASSATSKPSGFGSSTFGSTGFGSAGFGNSGFGSNGSGSNSGGAFGLSFSGGNTNPAPSASTSSGFGSSGFGSAGFGSNTTGGAFGSQKTSSGFGSAGFGQSGSSAFGSGPGAFGLQSSNNSLSPFGSNNGATATNNSNSGLGATASNSAFGSSGFGASKPNNTSGFGSSGFGSNGFGSSGFGQSGFGSSNSTASGAFGQQKTATQNQLAPNSTSTGAFGAAPSAFGSTQNNTSSAFGGPATNTNQNTAAANPFGSTTQGAFGQPAQASSTGFGQSTSAFGGFGSTPPASGTAPTSSGFGTTSAASAFGAIANSANSSSAGFGSVSASQPSGAAAASLDKFDPEVAKAFMAAGFELGKVPEVAPPPQVC